MSAPAQTRVIEGLNVSSTPLPPFRSLDLLPEIMGLMEPGAGASSDVAMFAAIAKGLGNGKLRTLLPQLLAGTKLTITEGGSPMTVTLNDVPTIDLAFDGRMKALPAVVGFAMEVSFRDFLDGLAQIVKDLRKPSP